jgi:hypothetical protein
MPIELDKDLLRLRTAVLVCEQQHRDPDAHLAGLTCQYCNAADTEASDAITRVHVRILTCQQLAMEGVMGLLAELEDPSFTHFNVMEIAKWNMLLTNRVRELGLMITLANGFEPVGSMPIDEDKLKDLMSTVRERSGMPIGQMLSRTPPTTEPYQPMVRRKGDMGEGTRLQLVKEDDGDVIVSVYPVNGAPNDECEIQFCSPGSGGGKSPETWKALLALMAAINKDSADGRES